MMRLLALTALLMAACPLAGALTLSADPTPTAAPTADSAAIPVLAPADTATPGAQTADTCKVIAHALNVRSCPAATCEAVAWLSLGDAVSVSAELDGWKRIPAGYVSAAYCVEVK